MSSSYRVQDGCHNCRHSIYDGEYFEEPDALLCNRDGSMPPYPGRIRDRAERRAAWPAWTHWAQQPGRRVDDCGVCDAWEGNGERS